MDNATDTFLRAGLVKEGVWYHMRSDADRGSTLEGLLLSDGTVLLSVYDPNTTFYNTVEFFSPARLKQDAPTAIHTAALALLTVLAEEQTRRKAKRKARKAKEAKESHE